MAMMARRIAGDVGCGGAQKGRSVYVRQPFRESQRVSQDSPISSQFVE
jgi:hypothetical protein